MVSQLGWFSSRCGLSWDSGARRLHHLPVSLAFLGFKAIYPVCNWDGLGVYAIDSVNPRLLAQREWLVINSAILGRSCTYSLLEVVSRFTLKSVRIGSTPVLKIALPSSPLPEPLSHLGRPWRYSPLDLYAHMDDPLDHSSYIWVWKSEDVVYSLILLVTLGVEHMLRLWIPKLVLTVQASEAEMFKVG